MIKGTVIFYNDQTGFGFIEREDVSKDVFGHYRARARRHERLSEGYVATLPPLGGTGLESLWGQKLLTSRCRCLAAFARRGE